MYDPALFLGDYRHMTYIPPAFLSALSVYPLQSEKATLFTNFSSKKRKETLSFLTAFYHTEQNDS